MRVRRFLFTLLGILLVAAPAAADPGRRGDHRPRRIDSVTLSPDGPGTLIAVTFVGRNHPRLLRSTERIAAYAVADVDNDGDLDIIATSNRSGLVLWRNSGGGRFVFAWVASKGMPRAPAIGMRRLARVDDGVVATEDRYDAAMPRAPAGYGSDPAASVLPTPPPFAPCTPIARRSGRAPPPLSV